MGIVVDGRLRTNEFARGHSLFDHSVQAAASLADALLSQGNRVGLLLYSTYLGWTLPGYGQDPARTDSACAGQCQDR